jgi:hypothetical protein
MPYLVDWALTYQISTAIAGVVKYTAADLATFRRMQRRAASLKAPASGLQVDMPKGSVHFVDWTKLPENVEKELRADERHVVPDIAAVVGWNDLDAIELNGDPVRIVFRADAQPKITVLDIEGRVMETHLWLDDMAEELRRKR